MVLSRVWLPHTVLAGDDDGRVEAVRREDDRHRVVVAGVAVQPQVRRAHRGRHGGPKGGARGGDPERNLLSARVGTGAEIFDQPAGALGARADRRRAAGRGSTSWRARRERKQSDENSNARRYRLSTTSRSVPRALFRTPPPPLDEKCPPSPPRPCLSRPRSPPPRRARALPLGRPRRRPVERPRHRLRVQIPPAEVKGPPRQRIRAGGHRDPEECAETGYKSSWKNIVVRPEREFDAGSAKRTATPRGPRPPRAIRAGKKTHEARTEPGQPPFRGRVPPGLDVARPVFTVSARKHASNAFFHHPLTLPPSRRHRLAARGHGRGRHDPHEPQLPRADPPGVPQLDVPHPHRVRRRHVSLRRRRRRPSWTSADTRR